MDDDDDAENAADDSRMDEGEAGDDENNDGTVGNTTVTNKHIRRAKKTKHIMTTPGQTAASNARKKVGAMNRRGQLRNGQRVIKKSSQGEAKKKVNKKVRGKSQARF
jgi:hypothetical protein